MINEDPKIQQLYQSLQNCIKQLDQIIYAYRKVPKIQCKTDAERIENKHESVENDQSSPEIKQLKEELQTLKDQHEERNKKLMELRQQLLILQVKYNGLNEEFQAQIELLKQYKITKINPKYLELPREEINLYKSVKTYISLNQSNFSLFLKSLLHENKVDYFLNLDQLLNSIQDYYKYQQMYLKPKFSLNTVERLRLPSLEVRYFTNRRYKDQSISLNQESRSQSFA